MNPQRFINKFGTWGASRRIAMYLALGKFLSCGCLFFIGGPCLVLLAIYILTMAIFKTPFTLR